MKMNFYFDWLQLLFELFKLLLLLCFVLRVKLLRRNEQNIANLKHRYMFLGILMKKVQSYNDQNTNEMLIWSSVHLYGY